MARSRGRAGGWRLTPLGRLVVPLGALVVLGALVATVLVLVDRDTLPRFPASYGCTVTVGDHTVDLTLEQAENASLISAISIQRGLPARAASIALATAFQESKILNIDYGDRDSLGLFQQRPSQGWGTAEQVMDPLYSTNAFLDGLVTVPDYTELPVTEAAQRVQRSAFPDAYADHEPEGRAFASALTGHSPAALSCRLPMPDDGADVPAAVASRLEQDLGIAAVPDGDGVTVDPAQLGGEGRFAWAVAHWAVATAHSTGATTVEVAGQVWERADGNEAQWKPADGADTGPAVVRIS